MSIHNIRFCAEIKIMICGYPSYLKLWYKKSFGVCIIIRGMTGKF